MRHRTLLSLLGAAALLVQPQLAAAQQACLAEEELSAMAIYAVPGVVRSVQLTCGAELSRDGWLAREGTGFSSRYSARQAGAWPSAKAALLKMITGQAVDAQAAQTLALISSLPDENVRPMVDALIVQEVSAKIPVADCGKIERVLKAIAPIEPEVAGTLIGVAAGLFAEEQALICPPRPA